MRPIHLTRIAHVLPFVKMLTRAGVDHQAYFRRWSLPVSLFDQVDNYVPDLQLLGALRDIAVHERIDDPGFLAFQLWSPTRLHPMVLNQARNGISLRQRLSLVRPLCRLEYTDLVLDIANDGTNTRIACLGRRLSGAEPCAAWLDLALLLALVRETVGKAWLPVEVTVRANYVPCRAALAAFPNVRFLVNRPYTSILVPNSLMDQPIPCGAQHPGAAIAEDADTLARVFARDTASRLKLVLRSYFGGTYPSINLAAEVCGVSVRTLQRELTRLGTTYLELVQDLRLTRAVSLLSEGRTKIIDVALSVGYEDASHFARAFKRLTGMSPRDYRRIAAAA